jgi:hypothetical protein
VEQSPRRWAVAVLAAGEIQRNNSKAMQNRLQTPANTSHRTLLKLAAFMVVLAGAMVLAGCDTADSSGSSDNSGSSSHEHQH